METLRDAKLTLTDKLKINDLILLLSSTASSPLSLSCQIDVMNEDNVQVQPLHD